MFVRFFFSFLHYPLICSSSKAVKKATSRATAPMQVTPEVEAEEEDGEPLRVEEEEAVDEVVVVVVVGGAPSVISVVKLGISLGLLTLLVLRAD
jgi:hypothetical protein